MSERRRLLLLWLASLSVLSAVAASLANPGSLDACYHLHVAQNMAQGRGMVEDIIWNYLEKSEAALRLPRPSHLYWMPLSSWLAWLGIASLSGVLAPFAAAQVPFVLLASLIPVLAYQIALRLWADRSRALLAFVLCLCAPNYLQTWVVPEPVTPFCLAAALCFFACARARRGQLRYWLLAGLSAGLAHLTRADGALLLLSTALYAWREHGRSFPSSRADPRASTRALLPPLALVGLGYLALMAPWFARNYALIGSPMPLSVGRTAWLHSYDEIFSYQRVPSAARWFHGDALSLLFERVTGGVEVVLHFLAMFQYVLPPLVALAWLSLGKEQRKSFGGAANYAGLLLLSMALIFPYPAQGGTLFRGASALVPWAMALVPDGLERAARAYARLRGHCEQLAHAIFRGGLVFVVVLVALLFHVHRLYGILPHADRLWNRRLAHYAEIERFLRAHGERGPVLVYDPPGYTLTTGRPAIVVPSDGPRAVSAAADRYGARWLLLEANVHSLLPALRGKSELAGFRPVRTFRDEMGSPVRLMMRSP